MCKENNTSNKFIRPRFDIGEIFRNNQDLLPNLTNEERKIVNALINCKTDMLGGTKIRCKCCGHEEIIYKSCRNRHCPKCNYSRKEKWIIERTKELLPIKYFHVVFTIPDILNTIALSNKKAIYDIFFKSVKETLLESSRNPSNLGAEIGVISCLHTWGQNLMIHPHIHCIVTGGGLRGED